MQDICANCNLTAAADFPAESFRDKRDAEYYSAVRAGDNYGFENYGGPSAFVLYSKGNIKVVAASLAYLSETGQQLACSGTAAGVAQCLRNEPLTLNYQKDGQAVYQQAILRAIATGMEQQCETWRLVFSQNCGQAEVCLSSRIKLLASNQNQHLLYVTVQNVTEDRLKLAMVSENETKFRSAADQANIYAWEYNIATHEMRPCTRCMRDLGLPAVVKNYPEPVIASGLFPPDYADMYRRWHRRLEQGEEKLEAIIPLTADRIPFHVRYTTEFNEQHQPVRAFASATLVVDKAQESVGTGNGAADILSKDYQTVMRLDFEQDNAAMVRYGNSLPGWLNEQARAGKAIQYSVLCSRYFLQLVHPDDVARVKAATAAEAVRSALATQEEYNVFYRVLFAGGIHFRRLKFFRTEGQQDVFCAEQGFDELLDALKEAGLKL